MVIILRHELQCELDGCTVIIHIDPQTAEFSKEFDGNNPLESKSFIELIQCYVREQFPDIRIKMVKIMIGSVVVATVSFSGIMAGDITVAASTYSEAGYTNYTVTAGDSLWIIAAKFETTMNDIKAANNLATDMLYIGQVLKIPPKASVTTPPTAYTTYKVVSGDSLYIIAKRFNTSITAIKTLNNITSEALYIGQLLRVPMPSYTVVSGDTLWSVASKFGTTIENIKSLNNLTSDMLYIGQVLKVPNIAAQPAPNPTPAPSVSYITHKVVSGDNTWNLSIKYGIPMTELLQVNGFTESTMLQIGQSVKIPIHKVPVKPTLGPQYGEKLDWWTEAQYVFPINKTAKITDFVTGRTFYIKRTIGANHADCEPLTAADTRTIKEVWGGAFSWAARAVIVEVDGRKIAASMASMPHDIEYIADNDFSGHFDLHFYNSTRHKDGLVDPAHQGQINIASGYTQK